ncbi:hypothetical protein H8356DRAFT_1629493 [Neocallimastix lanati (nom. inval.)]|uniref:Uncharacterized protein n=1 Tax=Neocallimastix californiae TaxID=1754190 RepID=A0A1Y2AU34_9FUNG|nr:hypothetical protein H8356DRAFT_1629493 [Neocallimastix sp. JGI-2020a]ORY25800.1 hypothetical protein LY90DRAFT_514058 [Neocallimastix californiae]|eukprot:ORY25800.1 hypothetical protein LY90DRAFT_514058 [Neocallimastix californiae]
MKFFTAIVTLFAAASVIAAPVSNTFEQCKKEVLDVTSACTAEVGEDRVQACTESLSEKCQNFFVSPLKYISECQTISEKERTYLEEFVNERHADNNLYCHKKSDGQYCPFGDILITNKKLTEDDFKSAIKASCQSKECITLTIESIQNTIIAGYRQNGPATYLAWYKNGLQYLQSNSCSAQATE